MDRGVYCVCGTFNPVTEMESGDFLTCPCGSRVVIPLPEEFDARAALLSAPTIERRVRRLLAEGVLPTTDACLRCRDPRPQTVKFFLACEHQTARAYGGQQARLIWLPGVIIITRWWEPEGEEIQGRDTNVDTPVALCAMCRHRLRAPSGSWTCFSMLLLLTASVALGYFNVWAGMGLAVIGLVLPIIMRRLSLKRWQAELKRVIGTVPVYRQILERYPWAFVVLDTSATKA